MSAQMIQISSNIFKCISSQSFCKAWRLLVSYLGPGHETKLNGHFRRGTSSKWLQDVHADFTTLILRKRCVKAGEIREDQENALKKSRNSPSWKSSPIPMMIMMVCNALNQLLMLHGITRPSICNGCNGNGTQFSKFSKAPVMATANS